MSTFRIYRSLFTNREGQDITILIQDLATYVDPPDAVEYVDLVCKSFETEYERSDDPHAPIKAARATFTFKSTRETGMSNFSSGSDHRFLFQAKYGSDSYIFEGYLVMDDNQEAFMPPGQDVTLTAVDGLGLLRNVELTNTIGGRLSEKHSLIQIIAYCLYKTGNLHGFKVADNLFEISHANRTASSSNTPLTQTYVDVLTWEKKLGELKDCYTVLETILSSRKARIFYHDKYWWIIRIDEMRNSGLHYTTFDQDGAVLSGTLDHVINKVIDDGSMASTCYFINRSQFVRLIRPYKYTQTAFNFAFPVELIANINFERGTENLSITDTGYRAYDLDEWTLKHQIPVSGSPTSQVWIRRKFVDDYETERYVVIEPPTSPSFDYIENNAPFQCCEKHKFDFGVSFKWSTDKTSGGSFTSQVAHIRLEGDDGSHWTLDGDGKWYLSDSTWSTNFKAIESIWNVGDIDETQWRSVSVKADPLPVTGNVFIMLRSANAQAGTVDDVQVHYDNLQFSYRPLVNGGYGDYSSERFKVSQTGDFTGNIQDELYLNDAICKPFKGAMFNFDGSIYPLTTKWNDWAMLRDGIDAGLGDNRIGKWIAYNLWNEYWQERRIHEGTIRGLQMSTGNHIGLPHKYQLNIAHEHSTNKRFILNYMKTDWVNCLSQVLFCEIQDVRFNRSFEYDFEFKYQRGTA